MTFAPTHRPGAGFVTDLSSVAGDGNGHLDMNQLLIKSAELMKSLKANMPSLRALAPQQSQGRHYVVNLN